MKQQHTTGPWHITTDVCGIPTIYDKTGFCIAERVMRINARLIASAPELLEALEAVDKAMANDPRWKVSTLRLNVVRTAIAKAKGEQ